MDKDFKVIPPFRRCVIQNFPFIEEDFDALTNYGLLSKIVEYLNAVIKSQNEVTEEVEYLANAYNQLKNYVDHYFDNLDVQEEVDKKLDEMAESGELTDIIAQYLGLAGVLSYNNLAGLKSAENIVNGSIVKTLGRFTFNDGGGAFYKVREVINTDVIDDATIIALHNNNLVAELSNINDLNFEMFGAKGDGTTDDSTAIQATITYAIAKNLKINANKNKIYNVSTPITITDTCYIDFNYSTIKSTTSITAGLLINNLNVYGKICNLTVDAENMSAGIKVVNCAHFTLDSIFIKNVTNKGIYIDKDTLCYELQGLNIKIEGEHDSTTNIGIQIDSPDTIFDNVVITSCAIGIKCKWLGILSNCHIWPYNETQCQSSIGIEFTQYSQGNTVSNLTLDSTATGLKFDADAPLLEIDGLYVYPCDDFTYDNLYVMYFTNNQNLVPVSLRGQIVGTSTNKYNLANKYVNMTRFDCFADYVIDLAKVADYKTFTNTTDHTSCDFVETKLNGITRHSIVVTMTDDLAQGTGETIYQKSVTDYYDNIIASLNPTSFLTRSDWGRLVQVWLGGGEVVIITPVDGALQTGDKLYLNKAYQTLMNFGN